MNIAKSNLQKDIVPLNRRYLLLVKQMIEAAHPLLNVSVPKELMKKIKDMTLEEIDSLAEDMITPCFYMNISDENFEVVKKLPAGGTRKSYLANVMTGQ